VACSAALILKILIRLVRNGGIRMQDALKEEINYFISSGYISGFGIKNDDLSYKGHPYLPIG